MPERRLGVWEGFFKATKVTVMFCILKMPECYLVVWKELFEVTNVTVSRGNLKIPECFLIVRSGFFAFLVAETDARKTNFAEIAQGPSGTLANMQNQNAAQIQSETEESRRETVGAEMGAQTRNAPEILQR